MYGFWGPSSGRLELTIKQRNAGKNDPPLKYILIEVKCSFDCRFLIQNCILKAIHESFSGKNITF